MGTGPAYVHFSGDGRWSMRCSAGNLSGTETSEAEARKKVFNIRQGLPDVGWVDVQECLVEAAMTRRFIRLGWDDPPRNACRVRVQKHRHARIPFFFKFTIIKLRI